MKVTTPAANQTEITLDNGDIVFVSYETPVAAFISGRGMVQTFVKWSATTTKHISAFIARHAPNATQSKETQEFFDGLLTSVKL